MHKIGIAVSGVLWVAGFIALAFFVRPESSPIAPPAVTHETTTTTTTTTTPIPETASTVPEILPSVPAETPIEPSFVPVSSSTVGTLPPTSETLQPVPPPTISQPPVTSPPVTQPPTTVPKTEPPTNGNSGKPSNPNKPPDKPKEVKEREVKHWYDYGACRDNPEFVDFPSLKETKAIARSKKICQTCPVKQECWADAYSSGVDEGIFGGALPAERRLQGALLRIPPLTSFDSILGM
jgi:Transcription factor WhiB.